MPSTITFFAPKGGVGRTTAVRVTASALLWAGKRVLILDLTTVPGGPTPLQEWEDLMVAQGFGPRQLSVELVRNIEGLDYSLCMAERSKVDFVLVDTPGRPSDLVCDALRRSTIIVAPANGDMEAALISDSMGRYQPKGVPVYGLITGIEDEETGQFVQACLLGIPALRTTLPDSDLFRRQQQTGHLFPVGSLARSELAHESRARQLGEELTMLCARARVTHRPPKSYAINMPFLDGDGLDHLRELHRRNPHIMAARLAE